MVQGIIGAFVFAALLGGGYYWYLTLEGNNNGRIISAEEFFDRNVLLESPAITDGSMTPDNLPQGAVMETGTLPDGMFLPSESEATSSAREITVTSEGMTFNPKEIIVKKGERIKIIYKNGGGRHNWQLSGFNNVGTRISQGGQTRSVQFVADRIGAFDYYCSVGNHRALGMWGTLTVIE